MEKPERPGAMERDDVEGAKAAALYALRLLPYAYITGDLADWNAMSREGCKFCASVTEDVTNLHRDGGYSTGSDIVVEYVDGRPPSGGREYFEILIEGTVMPSVNVGGDGAVLEEFEEGRLTFFVAVSRVNNSWVIYGVDTEDPDE
ncbi:DUF6318 family protein [Georgenia sp. TF02-10]|uniref:DUF6318 family protein n=1 Tax=Georgenia sp. TF02-10 TaxID=2917725 RepID=UPI001FA7ABF5|nr:DUF6318 family protein [Georgenia sp. TF02-10]UNX56284.1 DUF6318 family protein [Georgenia sp. TF02-10]